MRLNHDWLVCSWCAQACQNIVAPIQIYSDRLDSFLMAVGSRNAIKIKAWQPSIRFYAQSGVVLIRDHFNLHPRESHSSPRHFGLALWGEISDYNLVVAFSPFTTLPLQRPGLLCWACVPFKSSSHLSWLPSCNDPLSHFLYPLVLSYGLNGACVWQYPLSINFSTLVAFLFLQERRQLLCGNENILENKTSQSRRRVVLGRYGTQNTGMKACSSVLTELRSTFNLRYPYQWFPGIKRRCQYQFLQVTWLNQIVDLLRTIRANSGLILGGGTHFQDDYSIIDIASFVIYLRYLSSRIWMGFWKTNCYC